MAQDDTDDYKPYSLADDNQTTAQQLAGLISPADAASLVPPDIASTGPVNTSSAPASAPPAQPTTVQPSAQSSPVGGRAALAALGAAPQLDMAKMQQLQQARNTDAMPLDRTAAQYKPGIGLKIRRGLAAALTGGLPGAVMTNYGAPNQKYLIDDQARQARLGQDTANIKDLETNQDEAVKSYQRNTDYLKQRRLADTADQTYQKQLATSGLKLQENPDGTSTPVPDTDSPVYKKQQAQNDYFTARKEYEAAMTELAKARTDAQSNPESPAFKLAQRRADIASQNAQTAAGRLGLSGQEFTFNKEKFYNPQPTAQERRTGDLAQSAVERIGEMRGVISKHPEFFGPAGGRGTKFQEWLGSQDPDAQTYLSAGQYLTDHSAGVFGGRGKYITEQLGRLTDPKMNPSALNAALDEAERAAKGFVGAGQVHHQPGTSSGYGGNPPKQIDRATAQEYLQKAGGDAAKARKLAAQDGYKF